MKGRESDFSTYPLHYPILCSSATDRWENQIHYPSYRINSSKVEHIGVTVFCVCRNKHIESVLENDCKRQDACYLGTHKLLPRIRARQYSKQY